MAKEYEDLTGRRFGHLTAVEYAGWAVDRGHHWRCQCDCGLPAVVRSYHLRSGRRSHCGCLKASVIHGESSGRHGKGTPEYRSWQAMKDRCTNPKNPDFKDYGGRGITVHPSWLNSFPNFLADVGRRPGPGYSIDRYPDPNGNYEPSNVRWATDVEQSQNRRNIVWITINGQIMTLKAALKATGYNWRRYYFLRSKLSLPPQETFDRMVATPKRSQVRRS